MPHARSLNKATNGFLYRNLKSFSVHWSIKLFLFINKRKYRNIGRTSLKKDFLALACVSNVRCQENNQKYDFYL